MEGNEKYMKYQTEEQTEMKKFFIVLILLVGIIIGVYFLSKIFIKSNVKDYEYQNGTISTTAMSVGTIFNGKEKEYYVMAYDTTAVDAQSYSTYTNYSIIKSKCKVKKLSFFLILRYDYKQKIG